MAATEPIRDKKQLKRLAGYFLERGQYRNYVLIVFGTYTALRISDVLRVTWADVYNEKTDAFYTYIRLTEQKTGKHSTIALHTQVTEALRLYLPHREGRYLFTNCRREEQPISRMQAWRIIHQAAEELGMSGKIACHSLRKTWGYHAWVSNKVSPVLIMGVYNHSSYGITKRYLGVEQDDLDKARTSVTLF